MRSRSTAPIMQITEDTPPDMLAGAMDLTVLLPNGRSVKMSVERSTPMMDLLVQITTAHHLQLSAHTLQALAMASSSAGVGAERALPFKPNTPIGALDTQHVRVLAKARAPAAPRQPAPGHQPFESTFRLKVHLPRNQLYVARVSRGVQLSEIMKKVCEEKNLDPVKYEFKHPANLDEVLDPKLTLNDYQITEIYVVQRGTVNLTQAFSTNDIMALRKEEERKQMHNKTGGGVLNLIFRRGKSSMGSGSVSSENRSASPTQSDDSRSVTPPGVAPMMAPPPPRRDRPTERPRPPQRKRRPAPPPPKPIETKEAEPVTAGAEPTAVEARARVEEPQEQQVVTRKPDTTGLTICHSRNSSDSSGYHEASTLSDHGNASLPRRPKSAFLGNHALAGSATNLTSMSAHSKSTTSLILPGRKKKAAPPPPLSTLKPASSVASLEQPSPLVASQPAPQHPDKEVQENNPPCINPTPLPRTRKTKTPPIPTPRSQRSSISELSDAVPRRSESIVSADDLHSAESTLDENNELIEEIDTRDEDKEPKRKISAIRYSEKSVERSVEDENGNVNSQVVTKFRLSYEVPVSDSEEADDEKHLKSLPELQRENINMIFNLPDFRANKDIKPPEIVAMIPKTPKEERKATKTDTFGKKQCFQIGNSLLELNFDAISVQSKDSRCDEISRTNSTGSALESSDFVDEISDVDDSLFSGSLSRATAPKRDVLDQLYGIHHYEDSDSGKLPKVESAGSLRSSISDIFVGSNMKKWNNIEDLDEISLISFDKKGKWVADDTSDSESLYSTNLAQSTILDSLVASNLSPTKNNETQNVSPEPHKSLDSTDSGIAQDTQSFKQEAEIRNSKEENTVKEPIRPISPPPPPVIEEIQLTKTENKVEPEIEKTSEEVNEIDWQYQLPSPPKAFRDSSPPSFVKDQTNQSVVTDFKDSVVTSPELFEKLKVLEDNQSELDALKSDQTSVISEEEKPLNTLSLECLEKRQSLVYNRELSTSLKMTDNLDMDKADTFSGSLTKFEATFENVSKGKSISNEKRDFKPVSKTHTLPNFKITTYDVPKQKIKVFEDDTIRSNTDFKPATFSQVKPSLTRSYVGQSMENISSIRKKSIEMHSDDDRKTKEYYFYKDQQRKGSLQKSYGPTSIVNRSESFSTDNGWSPSKPVSRSKSQLVLNKERQDKSVSNQEEAMSRSSSLYDVSTGLQSLGVMKLIQNKLNTPTTSMENLHQKDKPPAPVKVEINKEPTPPPTPEVKKPTPPPQEKVYQYRGPPSINLGTWSERPKLPVSVKEDADYKLGNHGNVSSKLIVNTSNNNIISNNSVEVKSNYSSPVKVNEQKPVSIRVNGSDQITQNSGNVVIKIGGQNKGFDNHRLYTAPAYRKPFESTNGNDNSIKRRPHSTAFDNINENDISRVPVVRSVELKKPFRDLHVNNNNTSITQIYPDDNFKIMPVKKSESVKVNNNFSTLHRNTDSIHGYQKTDPATVFRVSSFMPNGVSPIVRGFQQPKELTPSNRTSWHANSYGTLPVKSKISNDHLTTNQEVPFSQLNLRRTESKNKRVEAENFRNSADMNENNFSSLPSINKVEIKAPPPPPQMPKVPLKRTTPKQLPPPAADPRDQLLESIRNFGGKKGLKSAKVY